MHNHKHDHEGHWTLNSISFFLYRCQIHFIYYKNVIACKSRTLITSAQLSNPMTSRINHLNPFAELISLSFTFFCHFHSFRRILIYEKKSGDWNVFFSNITRFLFPHSIYQCEKKIMEMFSINATKSWTQWWGQRNRRKIKSGWVPFCHQNEIQEKVKKRELSKAQTTAKRRPIFSEFADIKSNDTHTHSNMHNSKSGCDS